MILIYKDIKCFFVLLKMVQIEFNCLIVILFVSFTSYEIGDFTTPRLQVIGSFEKCFVIASFEAIYLQYKSKKY